MMSSFASSISSGLKSVKQRSALSFLQLLTNRLVQAQILTNENLPVVATRLSAIGSHFDHLLGSSRQICRPSVCSLTVRSSSSGFLVVTTVTLTFNDWSLSPSFVRSSSGVSGFSVGISCLLTTMSFLSFQTSFRACCVSFTSVSGHSSASSVKNWGPFHHFPSSSSSSREVIPLLAWSAGLSSVGTYFHCLGDVFS